MKQHPCITQRRVLRTALAAAALAILAFSGSALAASVTQSGEQKNMRRVGHTDLQGRPGYQPNVIQYPDGRFIFFSGTHSNIPRPRPGFTFLPNPLNNNADEPNGTMIIDVTDPANPQEMSHIPVPVPGGQAQMARMCLGSDLNEDLRGKVYLMRNIQGSSASGYEVWDVTDVKKPVLASALRNIRNTHKHWWECNTGIAYLPGSKDATFGLPLWRQAQSMVVVDWQNPLVPPTYLRTYGLVGSQPGATGPVPPSLHGPISAHEHPNAANKLARGATADDIIGNRVYSAWGVGDDGVLTIEDRKKLLPPLSGGRGGTYAGDPDQPTAADLEASLAGILYMSPDHGGHTSMPVFGLKPPSYQAFTEFQTRDIVLLASESTSDTCDEAPHWSFHRRCDGGKLQVRAARHADPTECLSGTHDPVDDVGRSVCWRRISAGQLLHAWSALRRALERGELQESVARQAYGDRVLHGGRTDLGHPRAACPGRSGVLRT
jgi:hypothetical protein